jgi:hypothetical protein
MDRTSNVAFAELPPRAKRVVAAEFLRRVLDKLPYQAHTVLTDNVYAPAAPIPAGRAPR